MSGEARKAYHAAEAERIAGELARLGPEHPEGGVVRTVLRNRLEQERRRADEGCRCPYCEEAAGAGPCEAEGCDAPAEWEGWWRAAGPFGIPTGMVQRRRVCGAHKRLLIGGQPGGERDRSRPRGAP